MAIKLIRVTSGPAKGKYLLRITETGDIIHPNGYRSKKGQLPWNAEWVVSTRKMPEWAKPFVKDYNYQKQHGLL